MSTSAKVSGDAKAAKAQYEQLAQEYSQARKDYQDLAAQNTGVAGYKKSVEEAKGTSAELSQGAAQAAANQALQAGRAAGQSKAAAAMSAQNTAANSYNQSYQNNFNNQQNQVAGQLNNEMQAADVSNNMILNQAGLQQQILDNQMSFDDKKHAASWQGQLADWTKFAASTAAPIAGAAIGGMLSK